MIALIPLLQPGAPHLLPAQHSFYDSYAAWVPASGLRGDYPASLPIRDTFATWNAPLFDGLYDGLSAKAITAAQQMAERSAEIVLHEVGLSLSSVAPPAVTSPKPPMLTVPKLTPSLPPFAPAATATAMPASEPSSDSAPNASLLTIRQLMTDLKKHCFLAAGWDALGTERLTSGSEFNNLLPSSPVLRGLQDILVLLKLDENRGDNAQKFVDNLVTFLLQEKMIAKYRLYFMSLLWLLQALQISTTSARRISEIYMKPSMQPDSVSDRDGRLEIVMVLLRMGLLLPPLLDRHWSSQVPSLDADTNAHHEYLYFLQTILMQCFNLVPPNLRLQRFDVAAVVRVLSPFSFPLTVQLVQHAAEMANDLTESQIVLCAYLSQFRAAQQDVAFVENARDESEPARSSSLMEKVDVPQSGRSGSFPTASVISSLTSPFNFEAFAQKVTGPAPVKLLAAAPTSNLLPAFQSSVARPLMLATSVSSPVTSSILTPFMMAGAETKLSEAQLVPAPILMAQARRIGHVARNQVEVLYFTPLVQCSYHYPCSLQVLMKCKISSSMQQFCPMAVNNLRDNNFQRKEFLGDAVLKLLLSQNLLRSKMFQFSEVTKLKNTRSRAGKIYLWPFMKSAPNSINLARNDHLALVFDAIGLEDVMVHSASEKKDKADCIEVSIGELHERSVCDTAASNILSDLIGLILVI